MSNIQFPINSTTAKFFHQFLKPDGSPFVPSQPYVFTSDTEAALNFAALIGNDARVCNTGAAPTAGIKVTVTSPELPGQKAIVLVDVIDNSESGSTINDPLPVNSFRASGG